MQLKNKALTITLGSWASLVTLIFLASHFFLKTEFYHLEQQFTRRGITRVTQYLQTEKDRLQNMAESWAHWDTSYQFVQQPSANFATTHLTTAVLKRYGVQAIFISDTSKQIIFQSTHNISPYYIEKLKSNLNSWASNRSFTGYSLINDHLYIISHATVLKSNKQGPVRGHLFIIKQIDNSFINQIRRISLSPTHIHSLETTAQSSKWHNIIQELSHKNENYIEQKSNQKITAYRLLKNMQHQAIALVAVTMPNDISQQGHKVIHYYLLAIVLLGLIFGVLVTWIIKHQIVERILSLSHQVIHIAMQRSYNQRIKIQGNDELQDMTENINGMLATIEKAQEQKVLERTQTLRDLNYQLQQEINIRKATERQLVDSEQQLRHLAHHDSLTDLPNRALFDEVLNKAIKKAARQQDELAILFIDLDRFKPINDAFGHYLGDEVLKVVGTRFQNTVRTTDTIARQGGDEFIILLESFNKDKDIYRVAEKLLQSLKQPMEIQQHEFIIGASVGVSIYPKDGTTMEELTRKADMAMYQAKCSGGSRIHFYTEQMNIAAHERMMLEETLRHAIDHHEFINYYQPKLSLKTGAIIGVESLLRHKKIDNSIVAAGQYIKLAEETGLISQISQHVLSQACADTLKWQQQGFSNITMAINISAIEFRNNDFVPQLLKTIHHYGLDINKIQLELTESALIYDINGAIEKLTELHEAGFNIIVDDFETGYSSLSYLKEFPVDGLKIDKSFVDGIPNDRWSIAIIKAIITLAHNLDLMVIAEGVENPDQLTFLSDQGCDAIQGFLVSQALSPETMLDFLIQHQQQAQQ